MTTPTQIPAFEEHAVFSHPGPRATDRDELSILDLLITLAARKRPIIKVTVGFCVLSIIFAFLLPQRHTVTVLLLLPQQNLSLGSQLTSQLGNKELKSARSSREFEIKLSRLRQSLEWKHNSYGQSL